MRTLKFRAWDKTSNQMILFDESWLCEEYSSICWGSSGFPGIGNLPNSYGPLGEDIKNYILMQYTGLKDNNGKEIYEGDVLSFRGQDILKVCWDKHHACWLGEYITNTSTMRDLFAFEWDKAEVIGNVYENPELVEAK